MPAWLVTFLLKYAVPLLITWLQKEGYMDAAEALLAKGATWTAREVKDLKTYPKYPGDDKKDPPVNVNFTTGATEPLPSNVASVDITPHA